MLRALRSSLRRGSQRKAFFLAASTPLLRSRAREARLGWLSYTADQTRTRQHFWVSPSRVVWSMFV